MHEECWPVLSDHLCPLLLLRNMGERERSDLEGEKRTGEEKGEGGKKGEYKFVDDFLNECALGQLTKIHNNSIVIVCGLLTEF